ncbi:MAG: cation diffusion facilitator family transporter [Bacilli bacterium]|nr:cation diffusion facilitator family transporter [Bacilli bacterium]
MDSYSKEIRKVGIVTIIWNVLLSLIKVVAGILSSASSLISDGIHSASDVLSTVVVLIGAKLSSKSPDKEHPFGHERMESIASIILAMLLGGTSFLLGYRGIVSIINYSKGIVPTSSGFIYLALGSSIASIVVKFVMYLYTVRVAKKINSTSLKADAYHHLSDSLSSIGSVLGIAGLMIGGNWSILDPIASIIIALFILKVAFDIAKAAVNEVVDHSAPEEFEKEIRNITTSTKGVLNINSLKTRQFGNKFYVELEIAVDGSITVEEGHNIAKSVHDKIESNFSNIKHCMVHVDPAK